MRGRTVLVAAATALSAGACVENTAPGNDRRAELDPPAAPAEVTPPGEALTGVSPGILQPEVMTDADQGALPALGEACRFRMTSVGYPVLVYGSSAVVKLNGKLVPLPMETEGRYAASGISVTVSPLEDGFEGSESFPAEMVLRLPGRPHELGFHGVSTC